MDGKPIECINLRKKIKRSHKKGNDCISDGQGWTYLSIRSNDHGRSSSVKGKEH
jgi:hypothetical protein